RARSGEVIVARSPTSASEGACAEQILAKRAPGCSGMRWLCLFAYFFGVTSAGLAGPQELRLSLQDYSTGRTPPTGTRVRRTPAAHKLLISMLLRLKLLSEQGCPQPRGAVSPPFLPEKMNLSAY